MFSTCDAHVCIMTQISMEKEDCIYVNWAMGISFYAQDKAIYNNMQLLCCMSTFMIHSKYVSNTVFNMVHTPVIAGLQCMLRSITLSESMLVTRYDVYQIEWVFLKDVLYPWRPRLCFQIENE